MEALEELMIKREDGIRLMPELFMVPGDKVGVPLRTWKRRIFELITPHVCVST